MNATASALSKTTFSTQHMSAFLLSRQFWLGFVLATLVLLSALALAYTRDINRFTFIQIHQLMHANSKLQVRWGQLLLEKSSWSTARIHHIAQAQLSMQAPTGSRVTMVYQ